MKFQTPKVPNHVLEHRSLFIWFGWLLQVNFMVSRIWIPARTAKHQQCADVVCQNWAKLLDPSLKMSNISCCLLFTVNVLLLMGSKETFHSGVNLETRENNQTSTPCCCGLTDLGKTRMTISEHDRAKSLNHCSLSLCSVI